MTTQADKGISIAYNFLNLPAQVVQNGVTTQYVYRAYGTKLKKSYGTGKVTDYLDGFQYELENGVAKLQFVPTGEGYYDFVKNLYIYNYVDHLDRQEQSESFKRSLRAKLSKVKLHQKQRRRSGDIRREQLLSVWFKAQWI